MVKIKKKKKKKKGINKNNSLLYQISVRYPCKLSLST